MRRRDFIAGIGKLALPLRAHAQQPRKTPRIGVLLPGTPASLRADQALLEGLPPLARGLGYGRSQGGRRTAVPRRLASGASPSTFSFTRGDCPVLVGRHLLADRLGAP